MNYLLDFLITVFIKLISFLPNGTGKINLIINLTKLRKRVLPDLFDNPEFLRYVYHKKIGIDRKSESINTLALRASTTDYAFYSPMWKDSYNLGLTSSDLFNTYHLYNNYRNILPKLKNVIVFFSVSAPGFSLIHCIERYRTVAYKYFFQVPYSHDGYINPKFEKKILLKCKKAIIPTVDLSYCGYEKKNQFQTGIINQERVRIHLRENMREPNQMNWLKSLLDLVNSDGRRLVVVIPPLRSDYKKILPSDSDLFMKLFNMESLGLEILNFLHSDKFQDTDFGDTDHLNEGGAIKLTNEIHKIFENRNWL